MNINRTLSKIRLFFIEKNTFCVMIQFTYPPITGITWTARTRWSVAASLIIRGWIWWIWTTIWCWIWTAKIIIIIKIFFSYYKLKYHLLSLRAIIIRTPSPRVIIQITIHAAHRNLQFIWIKELNQRMWNNF